MSLQLVQNIPYASKYHPMSVLDAGVNTITLDVQQLIRAEIRPKVIDENWINIIL